MTISNDAKLVTFINVFTVEPANRQRLVDLLAHATVESVRQAPGFVSATLHRSLDGTMVTIESYIFVQYIYPKSGVNV